MLVRSKLLSELRFWSDRLGLLDQAGQIVSDEARPCGPEFAVRDFTTQKA